MLFSLDLTLLVQILAQQHTAVSWPDTAARDKSINSAAVELQSVRVFV